MNAAEHLPREFNAAYASRSTTKDAPFREARSAPFG